MKQDQMIEDFRKELIDAERFGLMAVRTTFGNYLERWKHEYESLAILSGFLLHQANCENLRADTELTGTYLLLFHQTWDCARENLFSEDYHVFCIYSRTRENLLFDLEASIFLLKDGRK